MKNKLLELCSNYRHNDSNQVHLQKVIPTEADPDTTSEFDCFNVTNESTVAHNRKAEIFSHDLTDICTHKANPTWVNTVALFCLTPQDSCASWGLYTIRTIPSELEHTRVH